MARFISLLLLCALALMSVGSEAHSDITDALVGYWAFDEGGGDTAHDSSGTNNHGLLQGGVQWTAGVSGYALLFDGVDDYVICISPGPGGDSPRTVTAWAKTDTVMPQCILSYGDHVDWGSSFRTGIPAHKSLEGCGVDVSIGWVTYNATVADGQWHFYAFVVPNVPSPTLGDCQVYQDGNLLTNIAGSEFLWVHLATGASNPVNIGRYYHGSIRHLRGVIDEVRLYNRALSQQEINALYTQFTLKDSLLIPSVSLKPCDSCDRPAVQPVMTKLTQPINGASIPIEIPPEVDSICDISFEGLLTQDWDIKGDSIDYDSGWIHVYLANTQGYRIPAGTTTVFNILFTAPRQCPTSYYIHWDTALSDDPQRSLLYSDTNDMDLAAYFDPARDSTEIPGYEPGDINDDGQVNVADLTELVCILFLGCPPPCVLNAADCNGSCTGPNIADLTYLVSYLFQGGPPPVCGCLIGLPVPKLSTDISISALYENGVTTITLSTPVDLQGLQLTLSGDEVPAPVSLVDNRLELLSGSNTIGLVDLQGEAVIKAGTQRAIELPGEYTITEAIVSDMNHLDIAASIGTAKETTLPTEFALHQNYPNPFNPTTEISFSLPSASDVKLEVYNIMGQRVATVVDRFMEAGEHTARWDASSFSSGVYFYRLEAGEFVETRKMVLMK